MSLLQTLLGRYESRISAVTLVPSDGGRFEVAKDGSLVYSKLQTGRHPAAEEIIALLGLN